MRPSMTPSLIALPTMYSASSSESRWSLKQISRSDIREYDRDSRRMPVLMTFCRRRPISVYVLSASNWAECCERVAWNCDKEPARTAKESSLVVNFPDLHQELTFDDVKVPAQCFLENGMSKQATVRDIAHQELNHRREFMNCLIESRGSLRRRSTPNCLPQVRMGFCVIKLDGFDTAKIIVITSKLRVARRRRERSLRH